MYKQPAHQLKKQNLSGDVIIDVMKELNIKNILIMSSFQNLREKHICMNKEKEYFRYLVEYPQNIKNNPLKKMDDCSIPYFFVTDVLHFQNH